MQITADTPYAEKLAAIKKLVAIGNAEPDNDEVRQIVVDWHNANVRADGAAITVAAEAARRYVAARANR